MNLARADAQSRKIAEAARVCREAVEEERDDTPAEELAALKARTDVLNYEQELSFNEAGSLDELLIERRSAKF